jgi:hypothetical protein
MWVGARVAQVVADSAGAVAVTGAILGALMPAVNLLAGELPLLACAYEEADLTSYLTGRIAVTGFLVHLLGQIAAMTLLIHVQSNADEQTPLPIFKTTFGFSFILCIVSWVLDVFLSFVGISVGELEAGTVASVVDVSLPFD